MGWRSGNRDRVWPALAGAAGAVLLSGGCLLGWRLSHPERPASTMMPAAFAGVMPQRVIWAWEEREDLRALSPDVGVAYLAETLLVGRGTSVMPRRQPLQVAPGAAVMAVIRIETRPGFVDSPELRDEVARVLAGVAARSGARAIQVDFDATASQVDFYSGVLRMLRPQLPEGMPLSVTALVSWCGPRSWLRSVPIDEAVPMFFRMGGPRRMEAGTRYAVSERLCRTSIGLSTDEPWPARAKTDPGGSRGARVYLFAPHPWEQAQLRAVAVHETSSLWEELVR